MKLTKKRRKRALKTQHHARAFTLVLVAFLLLRVGLATDNIYNSATYRTGGQRVDTRRGEDKKRPEKRKEETKSCPLNMVPSER